MIDNCTQTIEPKTTKNSSNFPSINNSTSQNQALKQIKIDSTLTFQTASQRGLVWVKDTIFNLSAAPFLAQEIIRLTNQGYCLGQPNINSPSGILVGLYRPNPIFKKDGHK